MRVCVPMESVTLQTKLVRVAVYRGHSIFTSWALICDWRQMHSLFDAVLTCKKLFIGSQIPKLGIQTLTFTARASDCSLPSVSVVVT